MTKNDKSKISESYLNTIEKIFDKLEKSGKKVTVEAVRGEIGGSLSKICPAVRMVRDRRAQRQHEAASVPEIPDAAAEIFEAMWIQVYRIADQAGVAARKSFADDLERKETEILELESAIQHLEIENGDLEKASEERQTSIEESRRRISELEAKVTTYERELAVATGKLEERDAILESLRAK